MRRMISFYNAELKRFNAAHHELDKMARAAQVDDFISTDPKKISWTRALKQYLVKDRSFKFDPNCLTTSVYRPFTKHWMYFNRSLNEMVYQMPRIFPDAAAKNKLIVVKQRWAGTGQFALMTDSLIELQTDGGTQCFPLYLYDEPVNLEARTERGGRLFEESSASKAKRRNAITPEGLTHFREAYATEKIGTEDIFYYVYAMLHSPEYASRYADNLAKELPRIPRVKSATEFWAFSRAGRELADLHIDYEKVPMYSGVNVIGGDRRQVFLRMDDSYFSLLTTVPPLVFGDGYRRLR